MTGVRDDLPSAAVLPDLIAHLPRAGEPASQAALGEAAWNMLETYRTPSGDRGTRLSNAWIGDHCWVVQLVPHWTLYRNRGTRGEALIEAIAREAGQRGHRSLIGLAVDPQLARPTAAWRVPVLGFDLGRFLQSHYITFHMLFPEDRSFAIHANEGDFAVYAGPEPFLRAALPSASIGHDATAAVKQGLEQEHGEGFLDTILAHYAPFMLAD